MTFESFEYNFSWGGGGQKPGRLYKAIPLQSRAQDGALSSNKDDMRCVACVACVGS